MEKVIKIDGKEIKFKATGATPIRYRMEFGRDYFSDIINITNAMKDLSEGKVESADLSLFTDIIYILAKGADKDIDSILDWYDEFDSFPVFEIFADLQELLISNMQTTVGNKNKKK